MSRAALESLLTRHSQGIKYLREPGPSAAEIDLMMAAALGAPDHAGLVPWRFALVQGEARAALADLFVAHARRKGKPPDDLALEAERAQRAPLTVAVLARIAQDHLLVPSHEQWMAVGGAVTNVLNAAHALGYAGKMLSGEKAQSAALAQAFCEPGETLVGWMAIGTPSKQALARERVAVASVWRHWRG